ncbi:Gfo/Idh/MocA family protein [Algoriphagus sediminis]|uniref:Gfo/Idh/MocA family oxidoreductase n=1 Tax=Algoriphagus sediminis TaxID=3057113 RepID=A0ABT7YBT3_9BACT|nr:Gfo/Idh/MocA family oxidoreductase [Algoriphagus sediminis]MDN3203990.1 Gfo/Idh/MocA family oxidoreductase [Algoriphagus sediminis]
MKNAKAMTNKYSSRRKFLRNTLLTTGALGVVPGLSFAESPHIRKFAGEKVRLGFIGVGRQAMGLLRNFMQNPQVEVLAGADVYEIKRERFAIRTKELYKERGQEASVKLYSDYRELLENPEIDAVVIATPDHWHALMAIHACEAGKDIYLEKPLTYTVKEGQDLVKAVRDNNIVLAVGSMQRSGANFQHAVRMVQKGYLGKISTVYAHVGSDPFPKEVDYEGTTIPQGLDWKAWLGPRPEMPYMPELNPPITLDPQKNEDAWGAWRWYKNTGGGLMTDWGAHMFDIAQWGIGMDRNGPVSIIPDRGEEPLKFIYSNGIEMLVAPFGEGRQGVKFIGEKGWITVSRGQYDSSVPECQREFSREELGFGGHHVDFIDSVIMRKEPVAPVEVGHSTCTVCTIGNIAHELGRELSWDPINQKFLNDWEAQTKLHYPYQNGYSI